jgi:hypothetical protein
MALAVLAAGCGLANPSGAMQLPALVSGLVTGPASTCAAGSTCGTTPQSAALVSATCKDGVHSVRTDSDGKYHIALLTGQCALQASVEGSTGTVEGSAGSIVRVYVNPSQVLTIDLRVGAGATASSAPPPP